MVASGTVSWLSLRRRTPSVVGVPVSWKHSLTVIGTPANGPSGSPRRRQSSIARASARAASNRRTTTAFNLPIDVFDPRQMRLKNFDGR